MKIIIGEMKVWIQITQREWFGFFYKYEGGRHEFTKVNYK